MRLAQTASDYVLDSLWSYIFSNWWLAMLCASASDSPESENENPYYSDFREPLITEAYFPAEDVCVLRKTKV